MGRGVRRGIVSRGCTKFRFFVLVIIYTVRLSYALFSSSAFVFSDESGGGVLFRGVV